MRQPTRQPAAHLSYGPNHAAVERFHAQLRELTTAQARAYRRAMLDDLGVDGTDGSVAAAGARHADVIRRVIQRTVRAGRAQEHANAMRDADQALAVSGQAAEGIGAYTRDVAGALAVRDVILPEDFDFLYRPWAAAVERARASDRAETASGAPADR